MSRSRSDRERSRQKKDEPTMFESLYNSLPTFQQVKEATYQGSIVVAKGAQEGYNAVAGWVAPVQQEKEEEMRSRSDRARNDRSRSERSRGESDRSVRSRSESGRSEGGRSESIRSGSNRSSSSRSKKQPVISSRGDSISDRSTYR